MSMSTYFVYLVKPPTALEITQLLINHVFHIHYIPNNFVLDRGPQYISQV